MYSIVINQDIGHDVQIQSVDGKFMQRNFVVVPLSWYTNFILYNCFFHVLSIIPDYAILFFHVLSIISDYAIVFFHVLSIISDLQLFLFMFYQ